MLLILFYWAWCLLGKKVERTWTLFLEGGGVGGSYEVDVRHSVPHHCKGGGKGWRGGSRFVPHCHVPYSSVVFNIGFMRYWTVLVRFDSREKGPRSDDISLQGFRIDIKGSKSRLSSPRKEKFDGGQNSIIYCPLFIPQSLAGGVLETKKTPHTSQRTR